MSFDLNLPTVHAVNRLPASLGTLWRRCLIAGAVFFAALAIAILIDAWTLQREPLGSGPLGPIVSERVVHVRYYVLPWAGFLIAAFLILRFGVRAGNTAVRILADGGSAWVALGYFARAIGWAFAAASVFFVAATVQQNLFGFFLPP